MDKEELEKHIAKYKARKAKTILAYHSSCISLLLTLSTFAGGMTRSAWVSFLLVLPLLIYFTLQSRKLARKNNELKTHVAVLKASMAQLSSHFSLAKFMTQPSLVFRLSIVLFVLICLTTVARLRAPEPTLTLNAQPLAVSN